MRRKVILSPEIYKKPDEVIDKMVNAHGMGRITVSGNTPNIKNTTQRKRKYEGGTSFLPQKRVNHVKVTNTKRDTPLSLRALSCFNCGYTATTVEKAHRSSDCKFKRMTADERVKFHNKLNTAAKGGANGNGEKVNVVKHSSHFDAGLGRPKREYQDDYELAQEWEEIQKLNIDSPAPTNMTPPNEPVSKYYFESENSNTMAVIDSGSGYSIIGLRSVFGKLGRTRDPGLSGAFGGARSITQAGEARIPVLNSNKTNFYLHVPNAYYDPNLSLNILSEYGLKQQGWKFNETSNPKYKVLEKDDIRIVAKQ